MSRLFISVTTDTGDSQHSSQRAPQHFRVTCGDLQSHQEVTFPDTNWASEGFMTQATQVPQIPGCRQKCHQSMKFNDAL